MFVDARNVESGSELTADIAIMGAGAAGITLAVELASSGKSVLLLESGGQSFDPDTQILYDGELSANPNTDLTGSRLRYFGGTTNHWGGHCLPLDPIDFEEREGIPDTGWPIAYEALTPYYKRAHEYCDLGAFEYAPHALAKGGGGDFLPFDPDVIETVAMRQSAPTRFGSKYQSFLNQQKNVSVLLWANVANIETDANEKVSRLVIKTLKGGREFTVKAGAYVLACGAIANARLLLASKQPNGTSVGNEHDLVGRYYMDHPSGGAGIITLDDYRMPQIYTNMAVSGDGVPLHFLTRLSDSAMRDNNLLNISFWLTPVTLDKEKRALAVARGRGLEGLKNTVKYVIGRPEASRLSLSEEYCKFINNADEMVAGYFSRDDDGPHKTFLLRFESEQSPTRDSRVTLTAETDALGMPKPDLHWAPASSDFERITQSAVIYGRELGRTGIGRLQLEDRDSLPYWGVSTAWHQMGTTRMAKSPEYGVVDTDNRVFGFRNLYIAGASVFPTGGRSNPTLTLLALTLRLADKLKAASHD